jgi:hypothetical protein
MAITLGAALHPVQSAPTLWRLNGCGTIMLGRYHDPRLEPRFYSVLFLTFLTIPICPLGIYLVSTDGRSYTFYATISRRDFNAIYKDGYAKLTRDGGGETILVFVIAAMAVAAIVASAYWAQGGS